MNKNLQRVYNMPLTSVYPHYPTKTERKGRTKAEVDQAICWLTGHTQSSLETELANQTTLQNFFLQAPKLHANRTLIKGVICGVRIEEIEETIMRHIRYMDKLIDELAKGRPMDKILRSEIL